MIQTSSALRLSVPQAAIVIKYFFQFGFFPFNQKIEVDRSKPFHPPNILGVEKKDGYVLYDLLQLLALFFHRSILKVQALPGIRSTVLQQTSWWECTATLVLFNKI